MAQSSNDSKTLEPASKRIRLSPSHGVASGNCPSLSTETGDNTPDAQIDLEGPPAAAFLSQGAPCSRTPGGETPTRSPDVTDQLKAATSPTAGHAQAPASSKPIDDGGKATDGLAAKQLKAAAASLMAGQPDEASDMPAVGQVQPADGLMGGQADSRAPPVILILCGVPGSGKSTFCAQLIAQGQTSWVRVNQDSINRGRKGSRQQCLTAARQAVLAGQCCVIDRCHQDAEQRRPFINLAAQLNCPAHAVVLGLPAKVCADRAANRVGHEGGVQGAEAPRVVHMMNRLFVKAGPPTTAEGLTSIMHCHSDSHIKSALQAWCAYGAQGTDPPADLYKRGDPLRRASAAKDQSKLTQDGIGSTLGGLKGVPGHPKPATAFDKPAGVSQGSSIPHQQQEEEQRQQQQQQQQQDEQPQQQQRQQNNQASGRSSSTTALHRQLPVKRLHPDADHDIPAGPVWPVNCRLPGGECSPGIESADGTATKGSSQNAFALLMKASKGSAKGQQRIGAAGGQLRAEGPSHSTGRQAGRAGAAAFERSPGGWQDTLQRVAADPDRYRDQYLGMEISPDCVVINDAYPKARCHGLVIARAQGLDGPADLREVHLPLLQAMQGAGEAYIQKMQKAHAGGSSLGPGPFKMGFHSIPSMKQLHMHVISQVSYEKAASLLTACSTLPMQ
ncbi:hypothetical protein ABBQ32_010048 [Trebouxia sp. C0010 RCD-2024]